MCDDREALDRACVAVRQYLERQITRGEALEDLIEAIEMTGRRVAPMAEPRSFAANQH